MRISDWSSDVCSSDLKDGVQLIRGETMLEQPSFAVMVADTVGAGDACLGGFNASMLTAGEAGLETHLRFAAATAAVVCSRNGAERESVVEGKSVYVRGDLGGGRILKKKRNMIN